jgi:CBS domain containing-hemolysin-like protein
MTLEIIFTIFLVLLNGFFVAAEFAIVKVRGAQIDLKANQGHSRAKVAQEILANLDAYLSACQLGITLASLGLGWVGESIVSDIVRNAFASAGFLIPEATLHKISFIVAFTLITMLHIVIGEQAPKTMGIRFSFQATMLVAYPLRVFYVIFRPFIWLLNWLSIGFLRLVGIQPMVDQDIHTEEELRMLLTESEEGGAIKPSEHELIQNVFEFDDRIVKQIMVPRTKISAIDIELSTEQIIDKMLDENYSRMPVYQDSLDNIIGIIHAKDLLKVIRQSMPINIHDLLRPVYYIPASKRINELLREFQTQHIQIAIVTTEHGGTAGLVTMEDIIEELVGEIQDEYDEEKPLVEKKSDTEFIVNAQANVVDVNEYLPIALPESAHYDTVSGLINYIFGRIPAVNEKKVYEGYEITILKRFKHSVDLVRLKVVDGGSVTT